MSYLNKAIDLILNKQPEYVDYDTFTEYELYWIKYFQQVKEAPQVVKEARGIGAWDNPQIVIITKEIQTPKGFAREGTSGEYGHPWWNELGTYCRLRPFMESKKALKFFHSLLSGCPKVSFENTYITVFKKSWCNSEKESNDLFWNEYRLVTAQSNIVIELGKIFGDLNLIPIEFFNNDRSNYRLEWPTYYSKSHNIEWQQFKYRFCEIICEAMK